MQSKPADLPASASNGEGSLDGGKKRSKTEKTSKNADNRAMLDLMELSDEVGY